MRSVSAPASPQVTQFPEHRPFAAIDGDTGTAWLADRALAAPRHVLTVKLEEPREVGEIELLPYGDRHGTVRKVAVNGREVAVKPGWNRVKVPGTVDEVSVRIVDVSQPDGITGGAGGIRELRIPGVRATERLRPPTLVEGAADRARRPTCCRARPSTRRCGPGRRAGRSSPTSCATASTRSGSSRARIAPPAAASYEVDAWTSPDPYVSDAELDRLAGASGPVQRDLERPLPRARRASAPPARSTAGRARGSRRGSTSRSR